MWPVLIANLSVSILFCGLLLRGVRRFSRRTDELIKKMDAERDEILASIRERTDRAIWEYTDEKRFPPSLARISCQSGHLSLRICAKGRISHVRPVERGGLEDRSMTPNLNDPFRPLRNNEYLV